MNDLKNYLSEMCSIYKVDEESIMESLELDIDWFNQFTTFEDYSLLLQELYEFRILSLAGRVRK